MKCPRCQAENEERLKFCEECGAALTRACAKCGAPVRPGKKFCGECGSLLDTPPTPRFASPQQYTPKHLAERILMSKAALEGERKQVTVLFADLKGSMELLADRDPEDARKLLDPVLERMMESVHRYEGTVNQVMGDGIMALFGAPLALEDHAVRACYAALRMQEQISRYGDEIQRTHGAPIQLRVGLNSGEVVVRAIDSDLHMDYSAIGQTTHLAARMEQMAKSGTALMTAQTLSLVEGFIQVKSLGPVSVKGLSGVTEVFELVGAGTARTRLQAGTARGLTGFVGRRRELEVLTESLDLAGRGKGQVVAIVGEAGVGKSRLLYEFIHSHRTQRWSVVESGSVSYGKATSYLPVIDLLKAFFTIGDRDNARSIREKLTGKLLTLDRSFEPVLTPLLALLDQPVEDERWQQLDPLQRRRRTQDALKRLWLREAQAQPLILVFEDLHWIDSETQEFLDGLLDSIPAATMLLLFNYRPEYHHSWGSKTYYTQLRLDPLTADTAEDLLHALLGKDAALGSLKRMLIERAEGNPFFLEESVRGLIESAALGGDRGNYRILRPLASIEVPAKVQAILAARIDRLSVEDKRLLQTAAVIGKDVPYALLDAIGELPPSALHEGLSRLQSAEFLYEASLFPDLEYTFKHALTHDVAYASLVQERKRTLHARIIDATEALYKDRLEEHAERLAHHALHAEEWEKALRYAWQAARKSSARWAFREAARYLELALEAIGRLGEGVDLVQKEIDLRLELRNALIPAADVSRIAEVLEGAVILAERIGDQARIARAHAYQSHIATELCNMPQALQSGHRALALAEELGQPALTLVVRHQLTGVYHTLGDYRQAIEVGRPALEAADDVVVSTLAKGTLGAIPFFLPTSEAEIGLFAEALSDGEVLLRRADTAGHPFVIEAVCVALGYTYIRRGTASKAVAVLERGMKLCQTYAIAIQVPWTASCLGMAYALAGDYEKATEHAQEAVRRGDELRLTRYQPLRTTLLANVHLLAGRHGDAYATASQALVLARRYHEKGPEAWALYLLAASAGELRAEEAAKTRRGYLAALSRSEELGMRPLIAHCHLGLGRLHAAIGDAEKGRQYLGMAVSTYHELEMQHWLQHAEQELLALN